MSSYLYEGNHVICTHYVGTGYRKLQIDIDYRTQSSVLLVEVDIVIDEEI
ncbi:hypothetical protein [Myroides sp. N17-2]|nr:hypothetical protein [Myroides sp. N17-2]